MRIFGVNIVFKFFRNLAARKKYQQSVDDWLTVLFCGFPELNLTYLKGKMDYAGLIQHGFTNGDKPGEIGLAASLQLFQKMIIDVSDSDRLAAFDNANSNVWSDPISNGVNYFAQITAQMVRNGEIKPATERLYLLQIMGALRGASTADITTTWGVEEIRRIRL